MHSKWSSTVKLKSNNNSPMFNVRNQSKQIKSTMQEWLISHTLQRTRLLYIFTLHALFTLISISLAIYCCFFFHVLFVFIWIILCLMYNHHYTLSCLYHSCFSGRLAYLSTSTCLNLCSNMFFSSFFISLGWCASVPFFPFPCPLQDALEHKSKRIHSSWYTALFFYSSSFFYLFVLLSIVSHSVKKEINPNQVNGKMFVNQNNDRI